MAADLVRAERMLRAMRRAAPACLTALLVLACGSPAEAPAEGHLLLVIDTDAPLPSTSGNGVGVFDSLYLEVLRPDGQPACDDCVREIGLTREAALAGASFVVRTEHPAVLRARMFSSRLGAVALEPSVVVEHWVSMPAAPAEGATEVAVSLPLEQVGAPLGSLAAPTSPGAVGARLAPQPIEAAPLATAPGEVCVGGGWFWMGDPRLPPDGERSANVPRLVHVASFCVADHEATVSELRASGVDAAAVVKWSGTHDANDLASFCAFTAAAGPNEDRAVNCVPWATAREACRARGMDLPSEAQLEYLGTAFGRSSFVWGHDPPTCSQAIVGRTVAPLSGDHSCGQGAREAPLPATAATLAATLDVLAVPGGAILGLATNLSEWTRESFELQGVSCRGPAVGPIRDPECPATETTTRIAIRGGNFASTPAEAAAALRAYVGVTKIRPDLGFRCVR